MYNPSLSLPPPSPLTHQGFCTPPELTSSDEATEGTEFVDIEAGGFDEGEGVRNVSKDAEKENLVSLRCSYVLFVCMSVSFDRHVPVV